MCARIGNAIPIKIAGVQALSQVMNNTAAECTATKRDGHLHEAKQAGQGLMHIKAAGFEHLWVHALCSQ